MGIALRMARTTMLSGLETTTLGLKKPKARKKTKTVKMRVVHT